MIRFTSGLYRQYISYFVLITFNYSVALHGGRINEILRQFPKWREERLPPPRVSQSEVSCSPHFFDIAALTSSSPPF